MNPIKRLMYRMLVSTGAVHVKRKWRPVRPLTVLGYHQIDTPDFLRKTMGWTMTPERFREQMRYIAAYHHPIGGGELEGIISRNWSIPAGAVAVTFDDGYCDVIDVALPIMKELNIPGIVFLTTGPLDTNSSIWTNKVYYYFHHTQKNLLQLKLPDGSSTGCRWNNDTEKRRCILQINQILKRVPNDELPKVLSVLATALGVNRTLDPASELPMLQWSHIRELQESGLFTIGSHTVNHPILSTCPTDQQKKELLDSRARIEFETQAPCRLLAYPNGQPEDITRETIDLVTHAGYTAAFMYTPESPFPDIRRLNAPRHPIHVTDCAEFAWQLA
ncbi:polysaccharide deacetylase family protein [bacterium]|nr:polysaccharide deacetylase family protein [candidate division CSSED10-310 bacterium]